MSSDDKKARPHLSVVADPLPGNAKTLAEQEREELRALRSDIATLQERLVALPDGSREWLQAREALVQKGESLQEILDERKAVAADVRDLPPEELETRRLQRMEEIGARPLTEAEQAAYLEHLRALEAEAEADPPTLGFGGQIPPALRKGMVLIWEGRSKEAHAMLVESDDPVANHVAAMLAGVVSDRKRKEWQSYVAGADNLPQTRKRHTDTEKIMRCVWGARAIQRDRVLLVEDASKEGVLWWHFLGEDNKVEHQAPDHTVRRYMDDAREAWPELAEDA